MNLGMSGAGICVIKSGPGVLDQGRYMTELGPSVCPALYHTLALRESDDTIAMELCLQQSDPEDMVLVEAVWNLLEAHVWSRPHVPTWHFLTLLPQWLEENAPWLLSDFQTLYIPDRVYDWCMIHGDPTLANLLWREDQLLITDPIRPSGKIPALREVDMGKLLQSCRGYEKALARRRSFTDVFTIEPPDGLLDPRSWFWSCVNLARCVPYLLRAGRDDVASWATEESKRGFPG